MASFGGSFAQKNSDGKDEGQNDNEEEDDGSPVKYGDSQTPDRVLNDHPQNESPFKKIYEVEVDKFKIHKPKMSKYGLESKD